MIDRLDITDEYSGNCDFILNTVIFIDAVLNISLRKICKCNVLSFYLFGQGVPNETKGTINLKTDKFELHHDKTNKMACAPSEDSDQPGHPPGLIRVFAVRMKKPWVLIYLLSA